MLTLKEIRDRLEDRRLKAVAEASGVHYNTVWQIKNKETRDPSYSTIKALSDYFEEQEAKR